MNKETTKKPPEGMQTPVEAKPNPVAIFLAKSSIVAQKEFPVIGGATVVMSIIAFLVSIKFISVQFMVILVLGTIIKYSFQAGVVWQRVRSGKGRA